MPDLQYQLNARDEFVSCNEEWNPFARLNDGAELAWDAVVGRSLWEFIKDRETRHIYELLHARVRERNAPVRVCIRCDAPTRRRLLQVTILPAPERGVMYRVRTLEEEDRPPVCLFDVTLPRGSEFITVCGWCKRVETPGRAWLEVEEAVAVMNLLADGTPPQLTHGMCPDCARAARMGLGEQREVLIMGKLPPVPPTTDPPGPGTK